MRIYETFDDGLGALWNLGELTTAEFAARLARRMDMDAEAIIAHMTRRSHEIAFFEETYRFFKARHLPQAIVTVNPDLFSQVIVPAYRFELYCNAIVTSWEEQTVDKTVLCALAIARMGLVCGAGDALLLDNKQSNIDSWIESGGAGYLYTDDAAFARDAARGIDNLASWQ